MHRTSALLFAIVLAVAGSAMAAPVTQFVPVSRERSTPLTAPMAHK
jgi:hypothetical protein